LQIETPLPEHSRVSPIKSLTLASLTVLVLTVLGLAAGARDTSVKVLLDGQLWFCHTDPTGWSLADFKAVCSQIEPGGKGQIVEFVVDKKGKIRRKK
jgi:hypothetical protein